MKKQHLHMRSGTCGRIHVRETGLGGNRYYVDVQEPKRLIALTLNLVPMQPCTGRENKKRQKVKMIIFREIKVPGNIPVIQYYVRAAQSLGAGIKRHHYSSWIGQIFYPYASVVYTWSDNLAHISSNIITN